MALKDLVRLRRKKIRLFSDSMKGLEMIRTMESKAGSSFMWDRMANCLNAWEEFTMDWIRGQRDIQKRSGELSGQSIQE